MFKRTAGCCLMINFIARQVCIINLEVEAEDRRVDQLRNYWWSWPFWLSSCHHQKGEMRYAVPPVILTCVLDWINFEYFLYIFLTWKKNLLSTRELLSDFTNQLIETYKYFRSVGQMIKARSPLIRFIPLAKWCSWYGFLKWLRNVVTYWNNQFVIVKG